jgi:hypothetical protein
VPPGVRRRFRIHRLQVTLSSAGPVRDVTFRVTTAGRARAETRRPVPMILPGALDPGPARPEALDDRVVTVPWPPEVYLIRRPCLYCYAGAAHFASAGWIASATSRLPSSV